MHERAVAAVVLEADDAARRVRHVQRVRPELLVCTLAPPNVRSLALLPDGLRFVSGSSDKTARIAYHGLAP